jgi:hypothetical protein
MSFLVRSKLLIMVALVLFATVNALTVGYTASNDLPNPGIQVDFCQGNTSLVSNIISPKFKVANTGAYPVSLKDITIRYFYTIDGEKEQVFHCDYSGSGSVAITDKVIGDFIKMTEPTAGADHYLQIGFKTDKVINPGQTWEIQTRFNKADWSNYLQTNDYSFSAGATSYSRYEKVAVYWKSGLILGEEPVVTDRVGKPVIDSINELMNQPSPTATITCPTNGANIHYTIDGTTPTVFSPTYTGPIEVMGNMTLKAFARKEGLGDSDVAVVTFDPNSFPAKIQMSLSFGTLDSFSATIMPRIKVTNTGGRAIPLRDLTLRYFYTIDSEIKQVFNCDYCGIDGDNVTSKVKGTFVKMNVPKDDADYYLQISFDSSQTLNPRQSMEIHARINKMNWSNYRQNNDYSFIQTASNYQVSQSVTAYLDGSLLWGREPATDDEERVLAPVLTPSAGVYPTPQVVTITSATNDAVIYYTTDGSTPNTSSQVYNGPIMVDSNTTIQAYAVKAGMADSEVVSASYVILQKVASPTLTPVGGTYNEPQTVTIECEESGAIIHYTTDGSVPNEDSPVYSEPITVSANTTIRAYAVKAGMADSETVSVSFIILPEIVAEPTFTPGTGIYHSPQTVIISCATPGAVIHYTTDGTTPSLASPIYTSPIIVDVGMTIKAFAVKAGLPDSQVVEATYRIEKTDEMVTELTINPSFNSITNCWNLNVSCKYQGESGELWVEIMVIGEDHQQLAVLSGKAAVSDGESIKLDGEDWTVRLGVNPSIIQVKVYAKNENGILLASSEIPVL